MPIVGRQELSYPVLGQTGGSTLNDQNELMMKTLSDNANSRFTKTQALANGATLDYKHNLGSNLTPMVVKIWDVTDYGLASESYALADQSQYTVAAKSGAETTNVEITNNTGGPVDIAVTVSQDPINASDLQDFDDSVAPEDGQAWVWSASATKYVLGASGDASFKLQGITGQNMTVKAGYIILNDGRELRTASAADLTVDLSGYADNTYYFYININTLAAPAIVAGRTLYNVTNTDVVALTGTPDTVDPSQYIPLGGATKTTNWSNLFSTAFRRHDLDESGLIIERVTDADSPVTVKWGRHYHSDTDAGEIVFNMPDATLLTAAQRKTSKVKFSDKGIRAGEQNPGTWHLNKAQLVPFSGQTIDNQAADEVLNLDAQGLWTMVEPDQDTNTVLRTTDPIQPTENLNNNILTDITAPTYEFVSNDLNNAMQYSENTASAITVTIPENLGNVGDTLTVIQGGTGTITWAGAVGVTLNSSGSLFDMGGLYTICTAIQTSQNVWVLTGERG